VKNFLHYQIHISIASELESAADHREFSSPDLDDTPSQNPGSTCGSIPTSMDYGMTCYDATVGGIGGVMQKLCGE